MREYESNGGERGRMRGYDDDERQMWQRGERGRESWRGREEWGRGRQDEGDEEDWRRAGRSRRREEYTEAGFGNSVARVSEITAQSRHSFDDAIRYGIHRARQTLRHIEGVWVQGQEVLLRDNEIHGYRVQLKVTFVLDDR